MTITTTRTIPISTPQTATDALVVCRDALDIATIGTDFIFDPLNLSSWYAGSMPTTGAQFPASSIIGLTITTGGSGGTNGTFPLVFTGGGGSGAAGTFTVAGGALTDITMTAIGSGYTSFPSYSFSASAGLTGAAATPVLVSLGNMARDVQPALSRTKPVGLGVVTLATRPTFDGAGLAFVNGSTTPLAVKSAQIVSGKIGEPYHEGFKDYLEICVFKFTAAPVSGAALMYASGRGGGILCQGGRLYAAETNTALFAAVAPVGSLAVVAKRVRFPGAGSSNIKAWLGNAGAVTEGAQISGKAAASYGTGTSGTYYIGSGTAGAAQAISGSIYYVYRELISVSGRTDAQIAELVARIEAAAALRWA